jgi:hypothetical protein
LIYEFLLELFSAPSSLNFSINDFFKLHLIHTIELAKTMLEAVTADTNELANKMLMLLFNCGHIKKDAIAIVFLSISDIASKQQLQFSEDAIHLIQERSINAVEKESGIVLKSALSCIWSMSKMFRGLLDCVSPMLLCEAFKQAAKTQDFEVCCQILKIAALYDQSNHQTQCSEILSCSIELLSKDCCDSAFFDALLHLGSVQRDTPDIINKAVSKCLSEQIHLVEHQRIKSASSEQAKYTLPMYLGSLFGYVSPEHPFRRTAQDIVTRCLESHGIASFFGLQCLQIVPQHVDQLAGCFSDQPIYNEFVLKAFDDMTSDQSHESKFIQDVCAAFMLVSPDVFSPKLFANVHHSVQAMKIAAADQAVSAAAIALPKFLFFRKLLCQLMELSIDVPSVLIQNVLQLCFEVPLCLDGPFASISTVCVGILGIGLNLQVKAVDGECAILKFAQSDPQKLQAVVLDAILASLSNHGSNLAKDGMLQPVNDSILRLLRMYSISILSPSTSLAELTGSDASTKMFKSALTAIIASVEIMGSSISGELFQDIARCTCEFLERFSTPDRSAPTPAQPYGSTVQVWRAWEAFLKSQLSWSTVLSKAAIRKDDNGEQGYSLRDFTHSLRFLALELLSKLVSSAAFYALHPDFKKMILLRTILHLDDFQPEGYAFLR